MLLSDVKKSITKNMEQSYKMPDDDILAEKVFEALIWVATQCAPSELVRDTIAEADEQVLRYLPGMKFIVVPEKPDFKSTVKHLMIDETLVFAVINFTTFVLSNEAKFKSMSDLWISSYKMNDIRGLLSEEIVDDN